jgi:spore maturation protein CgeB
MEKDNLSNYLKSEIQTINQKKKAIRSLDHISKLTIKGILQEFFVDQQINIIMEYSHQQIKIDNQKMYLSLFEKTTNFNTPPQENRTLLIGNNIEIDANFKLFEDVNCTVYLIFYNEEKMIKSTNFKYSTPIIKRFECPKGAVSYRLALKIEGAGKFQVNELTIKQKFKTIENEITKSRKETVYSKTEEFKEYIKNLRYHRRIKTNDLKIAGILDEFSFECFKYDSDLVKVSIKDFKNQLSFEKPDFLFVESCWQGNNGDWQYEVANLHKNRHRNKLKELVDFCKGNNIPTVFWDKEGQENFEFFKEASSYFDYIFTADENTIESFKNYTNNKNVSVLPFAAQPQIHNPINKNRKHLGEIAFAGSYYSNKHDLRKNDMENILKPTLKYDIQIFDRYFGSDPKKFPNNQWPMEYRKNIVGKLNYNDMVEAYKNFDVFVNVNSVQNSLNMFARRVYEVLASRSFVISGPSIGVEQVFNGIVPILNNQTESERKLKVILKNPAFREKIEIEGCRYVLKEHTYKNRLQTIINKIGLEKNVLTNPKVTIISSTQREEFIDGLYENIANQNYENIEVVIILNRNSMNIDTWKKRFSDLGHDVKIIQIDESLSLGHCLNKAIDESDGEIIAKIDDDDYYAPNYLTDMVLAMDYSNADIVGKSAHYIQFQQTNLLVLKTIGAGADRYSDFVAGATLVFKRELYNNISGFSDRSRGEDSDFLKRAKESGALIYSSDFNNYCCIRRADKASHTWQVDDEELLRNSISHSYTSDYKTPVTF